MENATVNDIDLEYEVIGTGEPVLLISPVLPDGFAPLIEQPVLGGYRLIRYHKRGWVGSTHTPGPVSIATHAVDAIALLDHLGVKHAHVVGHSSGAAVAAEMALVAPSRVATLTLLELSPLSSPEGQAFAAAAAPVFELYGTGEREAAFAAFMSAVSGLEWTTCRALLESRAPGTVDQAIKDIDTLFGVELPALVEWPFDTERARALRQPVLSIVGQDTAPLWIAVAEFLRATVPDVEERTVDGVGHLLHIQDPEPVATALADFLERHPISA